MADGTNGLCQTIEVMKTLVCTCESRHILGPRSDDKERTTGTSLETTTLGLPIPANRVCLHVNQSQLLFQRQ